LAFCDGRFGAVEEADVLFRNIDVHESTQVAIGVVQAVVKTGMRVIERCENVGDSCTVDLNFRGAL
jgi:hypothetical protein